MFLLKFTVVNAALFCIGNSCTLKYNNDHNHGMTDCSLAGMLIYISFEIFHYNQYYKKDIPWIQLCTCVIWYRPYDHGVAAGYLCELVTKREHATVHTRRALECFCLAIPPISKTCVVSYFERVYNYNIIIFWHETLIVILIIPIQYLIPVLSSIMYR